MIATNLVQNMWWAISLAFTSQVIEAWRCFGGATASVPSSSSSSCAFLFLGGEVVCDDDSILKVWGGVVTERVGRDKLEYCA